MEQITIGGTPPPEQPSWLPPGAKVVDRPAEVSQGAVEAPPAQAGAPAWLPAGATIKAAPGPSLADQVRERAAVAAGAGKQLFDTAKQATTDIKPLVSQVGEAVGVVKAEAKKLPGEMKNLALGARTEIRRELGYQEAVDYEKGLDYSTRVWINRADNDDERRMAVSKFYPGAKFHYDPGKRLIADLPDGKSVWIGAGGTLSNAAASMQSQAGPMAGAIAGASAMGWAGAPLLTVPVVGWGLYGVGMLAGAASGAIVGKAGEEGIKAAEGLYAKSDAELTEALSLAGEEGAVGQAVGAALSKAFGALRGFPKMLGGQTPESKALVEDLLQRGYLPSKVIVVPEAKRLPYVEATLDKLTHSIRHNVNAVALERDMKETLVALGVAPGELNAVLKQIISKAPEGKAYGELIAAKAERYVTEQRAAIDGARDAIKTRVDGELADLERQMGKSNPELLAKIQGELQEAYDGFQRSMGGQYKALFETSPEAVYPTGDLKAAVNTILSKFPREAVKKAEGEAGAVTEGALVVPKPDNGDAPGIGYLLQLLKLPEEISLEQAHGMRSSLLRVERESPWLQGTPGYRRGQLVGGLEQGFDAIEAGELTATLRSLNAAYREGIGKFDNSVVQKLMADARKGVAIKPEDVINYVARPGYATQLKVVWQHLSPETRGQVAAGDFERMLSIARDNGTGAIDGKTLLDELAKRKGTGEIMYGAHYTAMRQTAEKLAAMDAKIPYHAFADGNFIKAMDQVAAATERLDADLLKGGRLLQSLSAEGLTGERAIRLVLRPGQETQLKRAFELYGPGTPERAGIQRYAITRLFADAAGGENRSIGDAMISGDLRKSWNRFTDEQKAMVFGDAAPAVEALIARVEALVPKGGKDTIAGGLAAGAVHLGGVATYPITAMAVIGDWLINRPTVIRWFAGTLAEGPLAQDAFERVVQQVARSPLPGAAMRTGIRATAFGNRPDVGGADAR